MNSYYGVIRVNDSDSLQHYGIKGMRWGVRKAVASGDSRALRKQYEKASKKLKKLNEKADPKLQSMLAKDRKDKVKLAALDTTIGAGIGGLGALSAMTGGPGVVSAALGAGAVAAGLGRFGYNAVRGIKNKRNASYNASIKNAAKRDQWKKEMSAAFKGTKYAKGVKKPSNKPKIINPPNTSGVSKKQQAQVNQAMKKLGRCV